MPPDGCTRFAWETWREDASLVRMWCLGGSETPGPPPAARKPCQEGKFETSDGCADRRGARRAWPRPSIKVACSTRVDVGKANSGNGRGLSRRDMDAAPKECSLWLLVHAVFCNPLNRRHKFYHLAGRGGTAHSPILPPVQRRRNNGGQHPHSLPNLAGFLCSRTGIGPAPWACSIYRIRMHRCKCNDLQSSSEARTHENTYVHACKVQQLRIEVGWLLHVPCAMNNRRGKATPCWIV